MEKNDHYEPTAKNRALHDALFALDNVMVAVDEKKNQLEQGGIIEGIVFDQLTNEFRHQMLAAIDEVRKFGDARVGAYFDDFMGHGCKHYKNSLVEILTI